jgi:hypothetical protein
MKTAARGPAGSHPVRPNRRQGHADDEEQRVQMATFNRNIGMLVLGIYLVLVGLAGVMSLGLPPIVMPVLALVAGILIIVGR